MAHSAHSAFVPFDPTAVDAGDPLSVDVGRWMANNALYACDSAAQRRIAFDAASASAGLRIDDAVDAITPADWYPIIRVPFLCHAHPGGGAFRFIVRLGGATDGHATATVTFRLAIGSASRVDDGLSASSVPAWAREYTRTGATHAHLTPTGGDDNLIVVPSDHVADALVSVPSAVSIGGARTAVGALEMQLVLLGTSDNAGTTARPVVSSMHVQEFIGP